MSDDIEPKDVTIKGVSSEESDAWTRFINIIHKDEEYEVALRWDRWDGYDLDFRKSNNLAYGVKRPDWYNEMVDEHGFYFFVSWLDNETVDWNRK